MHMSKIILTLSLSLIFFVPLQSEATKCLKKMDITQLKEAFPVVIKGKILSRDKNASQVESYRLRIQVTKILKGKVEKPELVVDEKHPSVSVVKRIYYKAGQEYHFPLDKNKNGEFVIVLPADGCPELP